MKLTKEEKEEARYFNNLYQDRPWQFLRADMLELYRGFRVILDDALWCPDCECPMCRAEHARDVIARHFDKTIENLVEEIGGASSRKLCEDHAEALRIGEIPTICQDDWPDDRGV